MNTNLWVKLEDLYTPADSGLRTVDQTYGKINASHHSRSVLTSIFAALGVDEHYLERSDALDAAAPTSNDVNATPKGRPWILHVDDDLELSNAIKMRLEAYGVSVFQAINGTTGLTKAVHTPAAAILLDYEMPLGDGRYVLTQLKANPRTKGIPVIILTGHRDPKLKQELLALGADRFLSKPFALETLLSTLHEFVELKPPRGAACLLD